jgi:hypothetical protein
LRPFARTGQATDLASRLVKTRSLLAALALVFLGLTSVGTPAQAAAAGVAQASAASVSQTMRPCTRTSSGSCIRGGQFCPRAKYGKSGWDARGRRYVCKGNRSHPHWMKP